MLVYILWNNYREGHLNHFEMDSTTVIFAITLLVISGTVQQSAGTLDASLSQNTVHRYNTIEDQEVSKVTVFNHGENGFPCIRIPSITKCGAKNTLHAFAECRPWIGDGCKPHKASQTNFLASLCYKNSTDDGATWSNLTIIQTLGIDPTVLCLNDTNTILLQYNVESGRNVTAGNWQIRSMDDGATWSPPQRIDLGKNISLNVGPGRGLQLSQRTSTPGRILFIGYGIRHADALVWYSDDNGKTYQISRTLLMNVSESQLVETSDGYIMANMRSRNGICKCRSVAMSYDGGKTFTKPVLDQTLISPVCQGTIISMNNGSLIFANPANWAAREDGLIRRSDDNGRTWPHSYPVTTREYGYSCLTHVAKEDEVGLLWETGSKGCIGQSCSIVFSKIKMF